MKKLIVLAALGISAASFAAVTYNEGPFKLVVSGTPTASNYTTYEQCKTALKVAAENQTPDVSVTYRCQQTIKAKRTVDTTPTPVDCVVSDWSAWSACASGTQTRTRTVTTQPANGGAACPALSESQTCPVDNPPDPPPAGSLTYTDALSYPSCAKVRKYTYNAVAHTNSVEYMTPDQAGARVHTGSCFEATTSDVKAKLAALKAGDWLCLHAGTYSGFYGEGSWYNGANIETYKKGTATQPITITACPNEVVTFKPSGRPAIVLGNGDAADNGTRTREFAEYLTFSGFKIVGRENCLSGGGSTTQPAGGPDETGGRYISIVGIDCSITDASSNTMTGLFDLQNDSWRVLGNSFHDPANRVVINNNHGVYVQGGSDNTEVAFNLFDGLHVGHVVQIHQDGKPKLYENVYVHHNYFHGLKFADMRGISVVNTDNASTVKIENNYFTNLGQGDWGCFNLYTGNVVANNNECVNTQNAFNLNGRDERGSSAPGPFIGTRKLIANGNKLCPNNGAPRINLENGAKASDYIETNPVSCN